MKNRNFHPINIQTGKDYMARQAKPSAESKFGSALKLASRAETDAGLPGVRSNPVKQTVPREKARRGDSATAFKASCAIKISLPSVVQKLCGLCVSARDKKRSRLRSPFGCASLSTITTYRCRREPSVSILCICGPKKLFDKRKELSALQLPSTYADCIPRSSMYNPYRVPC